MGAFFVMVCQQNHERFFCYICPSLTSIVGLSAHHTSVRDKSLCVIVYSIRNLWSVQGQDTFSVRRKASRLRSRSEEKEAIEIFQLLA